MPPGGADAITVEQAGSALVVRSADADPTGLGFAAALPPERARTAVVVDTSAMHALHSLDDRLLTRLADRLAAGPPESPEAPRDVRLVATRTACPVRAGGPPLAARLADLLDVSVVAPDGEMIALRGGELFSAGHRAGWRDFRPGRRPIWSGPRHPAPAWQAGLMERMGGRPACGKQPGAAANGDPSGRVSVTEIPAGLWVRAAECGPLPPVDLGYGVPVETDRPVVLVGAPGEPAPDIADLARLVASLPETLREVAVIVPYGRGPRACAALAQSLADRIGAGVRAYDALPFYTMDGVRRFVVFDEKGRPERLADVTGGEFRPVPARPPAVPEQAVRTTALTVDAGGVLRPREMTTVRRASPPGVPARERRTTMPGHGTSEHSTSEPDTPSHAASGRPAMSPPAARVAAPALRAAVLRTVAATEVPKTHHASASARTPERYGPEPHGAEASSAARGPRSPAARVAGREPAREISGERPRPAEHPVPPPSPLTAPHGAPDAHPAPSPEATGHGQDEASAGPGDLGGTGAVPAGPGDADPAQDVYPQGRTEAGLHGGTSESTDPAGASPRPVRSGGFASLTWPVGRDSTAAERREFRASLGWRYDAAIRVVTKLLAERPGLRGAGPADDALLTDLAAVRVFATCDRMEPAGSIGLVGADAARAFAACVVAGLRRLPAVQGPVVRGGPITVDTRPGADLTEDAPVLGIADAGAPVIEDVEYLIWSAAARRLDGLADETRAAEVAFAPGTVFRVLAVDDLDTHGAPARRVLLAEVPPGRAGSPRTAWADRIRTRLEEVAARRTAPASGAPVAPAHPSGRRSMP